MSQDLSTDERWPRWGPKVVELGVASALAAELTSSDGHRLGSINMYWRRARMVTSDDVAFANIFARHAAVALSASMEVANLHIALDSRKRIGQAQGIVMERFGLDEDHAFDVLRRYSQDNNVKLRELAEWVISTRELPEHPGRDNDAVGYREARPSVHTAD